MGREDQVYAPALEGKNIPILTLDEKWHQLFAQTEMSDEIKKTAAELDSLLAQQGKAREQIKDIKRLKKKLLGEIVVLRDKASREKKNATKIEAEIQDHMRLISDCNDKLEDDEDYLLDYPRQIYEVNYRLMLLTMEMFYNQMHQNTDTINAIDEWIRKVRIELKKNIIKLQEREIENFNVYSYMHQIFGPEVIDIFDLKYDPERRHPIRTPGSRLDRNGVIDDRDMVD